MKQSKLWGSTYDVYTGGHSETHFINVGAGGFCSKHKHAHKSNLFFVITGGLLIELWKDNGAIDGTILHAGESTIVEPGVYHRFTALENTQAIEVYWVELEKNDIIREDQGGRK